MPRLAPALEIFPTLARFQTIRPRRLAEVPIGGPSHEVSPRALQQSTIHLYHDLGVIVFAGCSVAEVRRIGDVLKEVVALGGPGGVVARLDGWEGEVVRRRERSLKGKGELYKDLDEKRVSLFFFLKEKGTCLFAELMHFLSDRLVLSGLRCCYNLRRHGSKRRSRKGYRS